MGPLGFSTLEIIKTTLKNWGQDDERADKILSFKDSSYKPSLELKVMVISFFLPVAFH